MSLDLDFYAQVVRDALSLGCDLALKSQPEDVQEKGDRDMVTEVDLRIEREIKAMLATQTPGVDFLGEEGGRAYHQEENDLMWTLDPIDGTANYVHGVPLNAISLALVFEGNAVVSGVGLPFLGKHYSALKGGGAYANGARIAVSSTDSLSKAMVAIGDYAVGNNPDRKNARRLALTASLASRAERVRMFGSAAIDLVWLAEGRIDAAVILANHPWDTAAGVLIAREAGALVVDASGAEHSLNSRETIAVTPAIADQLLAIVPA